MIGGLVAPAALRPAPLVACGTLAFELVFHVRQHAAGNLTLEDIGLHPGEGSMNSYSFFDLIEVGIGFVDPGMSRRWV